MGASGTLLLCVFSDETDTPFVMSVVRWTSATRRQSRERIYHEQKKGWCITRTTCKEDRGTENEQARRGSGRSWNGPSVGRFQFPRLPARCLGFAAD